MFNSFIALKGKLRAIVRFLILWKLIIHEIFSKTNAENYNKLLIKNYPNTWYIFKKSAVNDRKDFWKKHKVPLPIPREHYNSAILVCIFTFLTWILINGTTFIGSTTAEKQLLLVQKFGRFNDLRRIEL